MLAFTLRPLVFLGLAAMANVAHGQYTLPPLPYAYDVGLQQFGVVPGSSALKAIRADSSRSTGSAARYFEGDHE